MINMKYILCISHLAVFYFFFNDTATTEIYTLSLHDALPICWRCGWQGASSYPVARRIRFPRSEEHTSELQSLRHLVCRLLLEKKKHITPFHTYFTRCQAPQPTQSTLTRC